MLEMEVVSLKHREAYRDDEGEEAFAAAIDPIPPSSLSMNPRQRRRRWFTVVCGVIFLVLALVPIWFAVPTGDESRQWPFNTNDKPIYGAGGEDEWLVVHSKGSNESLTSSNGGEGLSLPQIFMKEGIYQESDFENSASHVAPPYWNVSTPLFRTAYDDTWGPCFKPEKSIDWKFRVNDDTSEFNVTPVYLLNKMGSGDQSVKGLCRPGFLILGAGKCGTSSLYHYLVDHPRVLPAIEKQIHYYKVRI